MGFLFYILCMYFNELFEGFMRAFILKYISLQTLNFLFVPTPSTFHLFSEPCPLPLQPYHLLVKTTVNMKENCANRPVDSLAFQVHYGLLRICSESLL